MTTPCSPMVASRPVCVSLGMYGRLPHHEAIALALAHPPVDPLLGTLSSAHLQLCPQNQGQVDLALADALRRDYPGIRFRLHANVRLGDKLRRVDLCDWKTEQPWFKTCAEVSAALGACAYTAHAGTRTKATVQQVPRAVRLAEQDFGIPVGIESHYPAPGDPWLISTWAEYRQMLDARVHYALDLSHLNILAVQTGCIEWGLVKDLLASDRCLEVHVSANDGRGDQHLPLSPAAEPWWLPLLAYAHPDAVVFSEGRLTSDLSATRIFISPRPVWETSRGVSFWRITMSLSLPDVAVQRKGRPALRLIDTRNLERADWPTVRKKGIGGSDAAAVGLSPYKSPLELWLEKTGRDADLPQPDPADLREPVYWGTLLEPFVAAAYSRQSGNRVRKVNAVLRHPTVPFMLANLDREVTGAADVQILECKTAGEFGARLWKEGVPEYVQLQVQHQLAVTGKQAADVAVLLCGQRLEVHRIARDDDLIGRLIELEGQFWRHVETDTPPPADGSGSSDRALRALYPKDSGQTLDFSGDLVMSGVFSDLLAVRQQLARQLEQEAGLKQQIQQRMGDATQARFERGSITWKRSKDSQAVDMERLLADHPELRQRYATDKPGSRRFVVRE